MTLEQISASIWVDEKAVQALLEPMVGAHVITVQANGHYLDVSGRGLLAVYPRVGGGTVETPLVHSIIRGLSPRGRGNHHVLSAYPRVAQSGLSLSRGRGNLPSPAGEAGPGLVWVYPRSIPVGGGTPMAGSAVGGTKVGSIPAWAGEPIAPRVGGPINGASTVMYTVYPRVGGGTPISPIPTRLEYRRSQLLHIVQPGQRGDQDLQHYKHALELQWDYLGAFGFGAVLAELDEPMNDPRMKVTGDLLMEKGVAIIGTPDQVDEQILRIKEIGGYDDFFFTAWFEAGGYKSAEIEEQMQLFATEVMPVLRRECGGGPTLLESTEQLVPSLEPVRTTVRT